MEMRRKYQEDCKNWDSAKGGFPNACFYFFSNPITGQHRTRGYVISNGTSHYWRFTKKQVKDEFGIEV